jgi:hypothetical protein
MTSRALIAPITELRPYPLPYGELRLRKGKWDQLQASKAYHDVLRDGVVLPEPSKVLDLEI